MISIIFDGFNQKEKSLLSDMKAHRLRVQTRLIESQIKESLNVLKLIENLSFENEKNSIREGKKFDKLKFLQDSAEEDKLKINKYKIKILGENIRKKELDSEKTKINKKLISIAQEIKEFQTKTLRLKDRIYSSKKIAQKAKRYSGKNNVIIDRCFKERMNIIYKKCLSSYRLEVYKRETE
mmetsp:Transcript_1585/g.1743  ORF Transcript_1585/g.1743 Transcript_1585/m.1743 type:complete len:181 (+) Transcript_1585:8-550(+)